MNQPQPTISDAFRISRDIHQRYVYSNRTIFEYDITFTPEASSRIYSPYVFAIGQLLGEIPYSILCAVVYWLLMVRNNSCTWIIEY